MQAEKGRLKMVIADGKKLLLWQVVLHWCTGTVCLPEGKMSNRYLSGQKELAAIFSLPFSLLSYTTGLWWRTGSSMLTSQLFKWHPAVLRKGRSIMDDIVRPRTAVTCWHVRPSRCRKNILCWALLITLEMFASYLMVLQMVVPQELEWLHCVRSSAIWACGFLWTSILTSTIWTVLS